MNTYRFKLEYSDGFVDIYETCGINFVMAHEMLLEYLKELPNPKDIVQISVECLSGELEYTDEMNRTIEEHRAERDACDGRCLNCDCFDPYKGECSWEGV